MTASEGQVAHEAQCRAQGDAGNKVALLHWEDIQARQEVCRVPAPVQLMQRPLQPPEPGKAVCGNVALHLANAHLCFLLESITFFTSPGLFTQTSCSLTTRIAFSAILLTAQMSAVSLGVWWELSLHPAQPSQHSF